MHDADHRYTGPQPLDARAVPETIAKLLDGTALDTKAGAAICLATVDAEGWPHAAFLSAGEILVRPDGAVRLVLFAASGTTANIRRDPRVTLTLPCGKGMCEMRMHVVALDAPADEKHMAVFEGRVDIVRQHVAPYADVLGGMTFALHEPKVVLACWKKKITMLQELA